MLCHFKKSKLIDSNDIRFDLNDKIKMILYMEIEIPGLKHIENNSVSYCSDTVVSLYCLIPIKLYDTNITKVIFISVSLLI
jgi:hypothetical protein